MNLSNIASRCLAVQLRTKAAAAARTQQQQVRKLAATAAQSGADESAFERVWIVRDVYPIVFIVCVASFFCSYTILRYAMGHQEVQWDKKKKAVSVAQHYENEYPGTEASIKPGARH